MSWALSWVLDSDKDVTTFQDALTHSTSYEYGSAKELKKITYPDNQTETFNYDNYGRLKEQNHSAGHYRSYTYDGSGWMTYYGAVNESFDFTYNNDGTVLQETFGGSWKKYGYTKAGNFSKNNITISL